MSRYTMLFKYGNRTRLLKMKNKMEIGWFTNKVGKNSQYFVGVFNRIIIQLALVGYDMIIANTVLRASLANHDLISNARSWNKWNNCESYRRLRYIEVLLNFRWEHSPLINDCPVLDFSGNISCGRLGWVLLLLTLIPPLPPKQHITPTLIPPAAQGKFESEWQTKNHFVDELAPLNRYLFIHLFTYPLWSEG